MPNVQWKWEFGPQTLVSFANLLVLLGGIIWLTAGIRNDIEIAKQSVIDLRSSVTILSLAVQQLAVDGASTKAKVELILPMVEKMNDVVQQRK